MPAIVAFTSCVALLGAAAAAGPDAQAPSTTLTLHEPLDRDWEPAWVTLRTTLPRGAFRPDRIALVSEDGAAPRYALRAESLYDDGAVQSLVAYVRTGLLARQTLRWNVVHGGAPPTSVGLTETPAGDGAALVANGRLVVRARVAAVAAPAATRPATIPPPIEHVALAGSPNGVIRLSLNGIGAVERIERRTDRSLPHQLHQDVIYHLDGGRTYRCTWTLIADEPAILFEEDFQSIDHGELRLTFDVGEGPPMGEGHFHRATGPRASAKRSGYAIPADAADEFRLQPFYSWWADYGTRWATYTPDGPYLGLFPAAASQWARSAPNIITIRTGAGRRPEAILPMHRGTRVWGLVLSPASEALRHSPGGASLIQRCRIRLVENPLDKVKDLVLDWSRDEHASHPRLLSSPDNVPRIRAMARRDPALRRVLDDYPDAPNDPAGLYLATGDEHHARKAIDDVLAQLRGWVAQALDGDGYVDGSMTAIVFTRPLRSAALAYDLVAASKSLAPAERDYARRAFAFMAYCLADENRWPKPGQGFSRGNVNFHSDDYSCRAVVAALLDGHPLQREWLAYVEHELRAELRRSVYPGGAWCEAPNYQGYTMHYLIIAMGAMRRCRAADFSRDKDFRATMDYFFRIQTPYDVRAKRHMLPTVGDTTSFYHSQSLQNVFAWTAAISRDDPAFAGLMMHAWRRGGAVWFGAHGLGLGAGWTQPLQLIDPDIHEVSPASPLTSERLPGYGALLRNSYDTDHESYFLFKMGQIDQHFDSDEGSFHWYALGAPLSLDFGSMYRPSIEQPWLHSTIDFDRCRTWTRGEVTTFATLPQVDYCVGEVPVNDVQRVPDLPQQSPPEGVSGEIERGRRFVDWRRSVVFVKGADYVVMRDDLDDADDKMPTGWSLQVLASDVRLDGRLARFTGQYGVDLDVFMAMPSDSPLTTTRWGHEGDAPPAWIEPRPMSKMGETQIALHTRAPVDGDYLAAMVPYRHGATPPRIQSAGPDALDITTPDGRDLVFLAGERRLLQAAGAAFAGRAGVVRRATNSVSLHILDGVCVRTPEIIAQFPGPVSMELDATGLHGTCDGETRTCFLHWTAPPPLPARLRINGADQPVYATLDGYLSFTVPAGRTTFDVRYGEESP